MASFGGKQYIHKSDFITWANFCYERQLAWKNKNTCKSRPWCNDEIINTYKFCNIYRELDRCSQYLINKVINNDNLSFADKVLNILIFRIFNVDRLFDDILPDVQTVEGFNFKACEASMDRAKLNGFNLFNNAYNITQRTYCDEYRKREKHIQHLLNIQNILKDFNNVVVSIGNALRPEEIFQIIDGLNFYGAFLSYQCLIDISYIQEGANIDWNSFVQVGPGARGGVIALFGETKDFEAKCCELYEMQSKLFYKLNNKTGKNWLEVNYQSPYNKGDYLSINNVQNSLCEFRKYLNYKTGISCRKKYYKQKGE